MIVKDENALYETVPEQVLAMKSIVEFTMKVNDSGPREKGSPTPFRTVCVGEIVVKFPDGRVEVVDEKEFGERFRPIQGQSVR